MVQAPGQTDQLYLHAVLRVAELFEASAGFVAAYSAPCPGKQTPNEDAMAVIPFDEHALVLVVADGMGGMRAGDEASRIAVTTLRDALQHARQAQRSMRSGILNGIEQANQVITSLGIGAATTLVVVECDHHRVRPYHVGDSMAMVVGQRGKIKLQTVSHSPVGFAYEAGFLNEHQAMRHEQRHLVSNAVGNADMRIEMGSLFKLTSRDTLLLATDGLFDNLTHDEIVQMIRKGALEEAASRLAEHATRRMTQPQPQHPCKPDDLSFLLFRMNNPQHARRINHTTK